jgi:hypothetical protein
MYDRPVRQVSGEFLIVAGQGLAELSGLWLRYLALRVGADGTFGARR